MITYLIYGLDGTKLLGSESSSDTPFSIDAAAYPSIGRIEFVAGNSAYVRISNISEKPGSEQNDTYVRALSPTNAIK